MRLEINIPDKYATKLEEVEEVEPTIRDQVEIEALPQVLRLINDAHRQLQQQNETEVLVEADEEG